MTELLTAAQFMAAAPVAPGGNTPWAQRCAADVRRVVNQAAQRAPRSLQVHLGPSQLGAPCDRQVAGLFAGLPRTNHVSDPWPSIVGTAVHAWLASAFDADNDSASARRWVTETRVIPHPDYPGTSDLYDAIERAVLDHKVLGQTSMAKVRASSGPPQRYIVQLLLYALGFRRLGAPVERVALIAYPRTASTLDGLYVWEHPLTAADDVLVAWVLERTETRRALGTEIAAGRLPLLAVPSAPDDDECFFCLAGDTEVVTRQGIKPIRELAGTKPELLVPVVSANGFRKRVGSFKQHPVHSFGKQPTYRVMLEDRRAAQEIVTTAQHRWLITDRTRVKRNGEQVIRHQWQKTTAELVPGDLLQPLQRSKGAIEPERIRVAVAQGFTFGDGSRSREDPASIAIYAAHKADAVLPYFDRTHDTYPGSRVTGLPRFWKGLPPISESRAFLLSWLAGYFAADGTVSKSGQCTIASADLDNIKFVRDVAAVCGVGYRPWKTTHRTGINATEATDLYELPLQRRDLPSWFFLINEHARRAEKADATPERESFWKVVTVEPTGRTEPVYCATVDGIEAFGLAWGISTMNCPFYRPQAARDGGLGCPGTLN